ncbi:MAG TPA: hypothetical protein VHE30_29295 [Polyangiaceae bacterium]|nr:hypothetical protein [Polyangiaceae bacterium]
MSVQPEEAGAVPARPAVQVNEIAVAIRNAMRLGGSLMLTWSVALIVKFQIPHYLGPIGQGRFGFAEGFATMFFAVIGLGIETYVFREVPVRPAHASDFVGGVFALRGILAVLLLSAMTGTLWITGRTHEVMLASLVFGTAQLLTSLNGTLASVLQSVTHVGRLAIANVLTKVLWGGGLLVGLYLNVPMWMLAAPMAIAELVKLVMLMPAASVAANLRYRIDVRATRDVLVTSFPFLVNTMAVTFGNSLAISALEYIRRDEREVGWFAASQNLSSLAMLLHPLLVWIVMPALSRANARSPEESMAILRRSIEGLIVVIAPITTLISAGSDVFIRLAFGAKYLPANIGLSILSLVFVMTYMNIILSSALLVRGESWMVTAISVVSICALAVLMLVCVPLGRSLFGEGGECAGAAIGVVTSEAGVVVAMVTRFKETPMDRRNLLVLLKSIGISVLVLVTNHQIRNLGAVRLVLDLGLYVVLALALGVIRKKDIGLVVQIIKERRSKPGGAAPSA